MTHPPVLIIDDDSGIREGLQEFLRYEGYEVHSAENGLQGLELIRALNGKCLVLLDLQMPIMSGEELIKKIQEEPSKEVQQVPILVLSARAEGLKDDRIAGFLRKPINLDDLLKHLSAQKLR